MMVKLWMTFSPISIPPDATVGQAAVEMARRHVRRLLVVDPTAKDGHLQGIVSLLDVARAFPADLNPLSASATEGPRTPIREVMATDVSTATPMMPIAVAARILREKKVGALPVVVKDYPVGIITESDVFRAIVEMCGFRHEGTSITLRLPDEETPMSVANAAEAAGMSIDNFFCMEAERVRTMTLRVRGKIPADAVGALLARGWKILDVHPEAR